MRGSPETELEPQVPWPQTNLRLFPGKAREWLPLAFVEYLGGPPHGPKPTPDQQQSCRALLRLKDGRGAASCCQRFPGDKGNSRQVSSLTLVGHPETPRSFTHMPSGHGKKMASSFGVLTLKGSTSKRRKKRAPLGN